MPSQPTRTDRVRCLHCKRAQTIHTRRGLHFTCKFCGKPNPGPAISEAVLAPYGKRTSATSPAPAESAVGAASEGTMDPEGRGTNLGTGDGAGAAAPAPPTKTKRAARVVRRPGGGAANRPTTTKGAEPGASEGQPAARPPAAVSKREAGAFWRLMHGG